MADIKIRVRNLEYSNFWTAETVSKLESDASEPAGVNHPFPPER